MELFFNIAGPCVVADHYMLPATERLLRAAAERKDDGSDSSSPPWSGD